MSEQDVTTVARAALAQGDWPLVHQVINDVRNGIGSPLAAELMVEMEERIKNAPLLRRGHTE